MIGPGGTQYKRPKGDVPPTWVAESPKVSPEYSEKKIWVGRLCAAKQFQKEEPFFFFLLDLKLGSQEQIIAKICVSAWSWNLPKIDEKWFELVCRCACVWRGVGVWGGGVRVCVMGWGVGGCACVCVGGWCVCLCYQTRTHTWISTLTPWTYPQTRTVLGHRISAMILI